MTDTTTAHTPGPWLLDGSIDAMNLDVVYISGRIAMLECENDEISDDQLMANARMIAAAPDMLAALITLVWQMDRMDNLPEPAEDMLAHARAAITKATGA